MKQEMILKSDLLDILFENRNKAYGAYDLRKFYEQRMYKSLGIMLGCVLLFWVFSLMPGKAVVTKGLYVVDGPTLADPPKPNEKIPEDKKKTVVAPAASTIKFMNRFKFVSNIDTADKLEDPEKHIIGSSTTLLNGTGTNPQPVIPVLAGGGKPDITVTPVTGKILPIDNPDIMPSFPGGLGALRSFLQNNLQNPKDMESGEEVNVKVRFVVDYDGKIASFVTVEDGGELFNREVMRVLHKMPAWIPGKSNGKNVPVYYTIPVKFVSGD